MPANAKNHIVGVTECVERDGAYLKGSLIIFHEDTIKAIESGERKEISLGYRCRLDPTPGTINGEACDAIQRDIVVNHVAIGPKGWGRAHRYTFRDCGIMLDICGYRELTINVQIRARLARTAPSSRALAEKARLALANPAYRDELRSAGLVLVETHPILNLDFSRSFRKELRTTFDVVFRLMVHREEILERAILNQSHYVRMFYEFG